MGSCLLMLKVCGTPSSHPKHESRNLGYLNFVLYAPNRFYVEKDTLLEEGDQFSEVNS